MVLPDTYTTYDPPPPFSYEVRTLYHNQELAYICCGLKFRLEFVLELANMRC